MRPIFILFLVVSMLHMGEEFFYPGGFMDFIKRMNPRFAPLVTARMMVIFNGLELLFCLMVIAVGKTTPVLGLSLAALLFVNGLVHLVGCFKAKGYAPGVFTAVLLFVPLSLYAYYVFIRSGQLTLVGFAVAAALGLFYQAIPFSYFVLASARRRM